MDINQIIEFAGNNALLVFAFFAILAMLLAGSLRPRLGGFSEIGPSEATRLMNHENAIIVDIRNDKDFAAGHVVNALHMPDTASTTKLEKFRERPLIVCCRSGQRSASLCSKLHRQGFEQLYNLKGGVLAWQRAELPLTRSR